MSGESPQPAMNSEKKILHTVDQEGAEVHSQADFLFWCPGCKCAHGVWTTKRNGVGAVWSFNGNMEKPTFNPSLLIRFTRDITSAEYTRLLAGEKLNIPKTVCHSFVRDGQIQFLGDCTHALAGKTVPMEAF